MVHGTCVYGLFEKGIFVNKRQVVVWIFVLPVYAFLFGMALEAEAQDSYMFLSKKGARWEFEVTVTTSNLQVKNNILTIVNEGHAGADINSTKFSWTFRNAFGVGIRMELFYERSLDGIFLSKVNTYKGSSLVLSQHYKPPVLALKLPLKMGSWEHRGLRVSEKGPEQYGVVNTVRRVRVIVPAGTFDAFEIQAQELSGGMSSEYWVEGVGLVGFTQTTALGTTITAQLIRYSHLPYEMLTVGEKVFSHRQSWGCASAELLVEAYRLEAYGPQDQQATRQLQMLVEQKKCIEIHELQGYIVFRRGDAVQINGRFPPDRFGVVVWVPLWSVSVCHRMLCEALY